MVRAFQAGSIKSNRTVIGSGFFLEPTIFSDVEDHMFIAQEESFGPVMVISKFAHGSVTIVCKPCRTHICKIHMCSLTV